jgi:hypothetical protein
VNQYIKGRGRGNEKVTTGAVKHYVISNATAVIHAKTLKNSTFKKLFKERSE